MTITKYRRVRGDMIEVFKIINNIYDASSVPILPLDTSSVTRGIYIGLILSSYQIFVFILILENIMLKSSFLS